MTSGAEKLEKVIGLAAAGSLAAAVGFAANRLAAGVTVAALGAVIALIVGQRLLKLLEGQPKPFPQPIFDILKIDPLEPAAMEELVLGDADRLVPAASGEEDEPLILDDVLTEVAADSRVVRLFDPAAMPTLGQLKARIDRHLDGGTSHSPSPDASEALFAALADLRRSLR